MMMRKTETMEEGDGGMMKQAIEVVVAVVDSTRGGIGREGDMRKEAGMQVGEDIEAKRWRGMGMMTERNVILTVNETETDDQVQAAALALALPYLLRRTNSCARS